MLDLWLFLVAVPVPPPLTPDLGSGSTTLLQVLGSAGIATVLAAVITAWVNKRKLGAEATHLITQAASGVLSRLEAENARLIRRMNALERDLEREREQRESEQREWRRCLQLHAAWDHLAIQKGAGGGLPEAPPLYPPSHDPSV